MPHTFKFQVSVNIDQSVTLSFPPTSLSVGKQWEDYDDVKISLDQGHDRTITLLPANLVFFFLQSNLAGIKYQFFDNQATPAAIGPETVLDPQIPVILIGSGIIGLLWPSSLPHPPASIKLTNTANTPVNVQIVTARNPS